MRKIHWNQEGKALSSPVPSTDSLILCQVEKHLESNSNSAGQTMKDEFAPKRVEVENWHEDGVSNSEYSFNELLYQAIPSVILGNAFILPSFYPSPYSLK